MSRDPAHWQPVPLVRYPGVVAPKVASARDLNLVRLLRTSTGTRAERAEALDLGEGRAGGAGPARATESGSARAEHSQKRLARIWRS